VFSIRAAPKILSDNGWNAPLHGLAKIIDGEIIGDGASPSLDAALVAVRVPSSCRLLSCPSSEILRTKWKAGKFRGIPGRRWTGGGGLLMIRCHNLHS
jgi:hypothetical protein